MAVEIPCECGKIHYCSTKCLDADSVRHRVDCSLSKLPSQSPSLFPSLSPSSIQPSHSPLLQQPSGSPSVHSSSPISDVPSVIPTKLPTSKRPTSRSPTRRPSWHSGFTSQPTSSGAITGSPQRMPRPRWSACVSGANRRDHKRNVEANFLCANICKARCVHGALLDPNRVKKHAHICGRVKIDHSTAQCNKRGHCHMRDPQSRLGFVLDQHSILT